MVPDIFILLLNHVFVFFWQFFRALRSILYQSDICTLKVIAISCDNNDYKLYDSYSGRRTNIFLLALDPRPRSEVFGSAQ
jgi:hypothetical protein